jgi:G3E family GTPase
VARRTDFLAAMEALVSKRDRFDYVLVETTGLADPSSIASTFWVDDGMEIDMTLDAIVTVIDAKHLERHLSTGDTTEGSSSHKVCCRHSDACLSWRFISSTVLLRLPCPRFVHAGARAGERGSDANCVRG